VIHWYSPFPLPPSLLEFLEKLHPFGALPPPPFPSPIDGQVLLFYVSPVQWLFDAVRSPDSAAQELSPSALLEAYLSLEVLWKQAEDRSASVVLVAADRIDAEGLQILLSAGTPPQQPPAQPIPSQSALMALLALTAVEQTPGLLDAYLDLEMKAELFGREPDLECRYHWQQLACIGSVVAELAGSQAYGAMSAEKSQQIVKASTQGEVQRGDLMALVQECDRLQQENLTLHKEATIILQQHHNVQKELEHYFQLSSKMDDLLRRHEEAEERSRKLFFRLMCERDANPPSL
jgi:hypothetical protein